MTNMSIQPFWLTYFIEILLVLVFQLIKNYFGMFSYKAHFRPQISSNVNSDSSVVDPTLPLKSEVEGVESMSSPPDLSRHHLRDDADICKTAFGFTPFPLNQVWNWFFP